MLFNGAQVAIRSTAWKKIMVHEAAREQAISIAILEFIPMEQHDAVTQRMEGVTRAYYDFIGLGEAYRQMKTMIGLNMPIDQYHFIG